MDRADPNFDHRVGSGVGRRGLDLGSKPIDHRNSEPPGVLAYPVEQIAEVRPAPSNTLTEVDLIQVRQMAFRSRIRGRALKRKGLGTDSRVTPVQLSSS